MSQISISRLRKIIADADAGFAASRQAMEDVRNAKAVIHSLDAQHGQRSSWGTYEPLKRWDQLVEDDRGKMVRKYPEAFEDYTKAHAVLAEAEAIYERQKEITSFAGGVRSRALAFVRDNDIQLPADLQRKI